ncbi:DUF4334 domain-containing protein [Gordonia sp. Z-3]|jgi:hypothetical protein|uniref:DUF4334 domain-containing protein n=2 Tax=Gordonia TaxID=2053 RepID=A0A9X3I4G4_9ACTN|nr:MULTISPECIES: DUF4334 domain-containing protein [Gordonia]MAU84161.1 hypothetical protein [Gordonia sp. (in: high G+C Gram-positive bacteria)]MCF3937870.1 DUF4334 domain-containing protein [Gordonia tangerina]MCX2964692.1 DUF4334 domain-containing protein [Gordonia aquimaris]MED5800838.1 DUF4334 domain-containing protein [Gordonia sp. Z-3]
MTSAPALSRAEAQKRFAALVAATGVVDDAELDAVWAALETMRPEEMFGAWKGGEFTTGHPVNGMLEKAGWYGKTFVSRSDVQPLVCRGEDGKLFSDKKLGKGEASLWAIEFRGEVTASMVYDGQPVIDHFKRVDANTVMGIMNGKGGVVDGRHLYFYLERD